MRQIGVVANVELANRFADYLRANGMDCTVDQTPNGNLIWVHEDDLVANAKSQLPHFLANPDDERYRAAAQQALERARQSAARIAATRKKTINIADRWNRPVAGTAPMTILIIGASVILAFLWGLPPKMELAQWLLISTNSTMRQIAHGEVWRLVTPIFLHFSPTHLIFNMLNLWYFGQMIEARIGTFRMTLLVIATAIISNMAQFIAVSPVFGGMSGVVYGLFGYIWVKSRMDPNSGFGISQNTVVMMIVWHILCVAGVIPHVANWCHGGGLVAGVTIAFAEVTLKPLFRRR